MYVNSNEMAWIVRMKKVGGEVNETSNFGESLTQIHCARCHGGEFQGLGAIPELQNVKKRFSVDSIQSIIKNGKGAMPGMPNLSESEIKGIANYISGIEEETDHRAEESSIKVPYAVAGFGRFKDDRGFPVMNPPWGTLNAINLNTGEYLWKVPFGHEEQLNDPNHPISGLENYGGPVITESGVLFIAATKDEKFRAYSMKSGQPLWEADLPAGGYATPATYEIDGKQFVIIACGGGKMGTKSGDEYRAYALPD
jgi:quinoprotein glucose dehydrogenase